MPPQNKIGKSNYPILTTDVIIEYENGQKKGIVLIERKYFPLGIAIPGGLQEYGITAEENARKEAREETSLEIVIENPERPWLYSNPNRDPRGHMITAVYIARGHGKLKAGDDAKKARPYLIDEIKKMLGKKVFAFDHEDIIKDYLKYRGYL